MKFSGYSLEKDKEEIVACDIQDLHNETIRETEDFFKAPKTVKDHCRRLTEMIKWIQLEYPDAEITDEQIIDNTQYVESNIAFGDY